MEPSDDSDLNPDAPTFFPQVLPNDFNRQFFDALTADRRASGIGSSSAGRQAFEHFEENVSIDTGRPQAPNPFGRFSYQEEQMPSDPIRRSRRTRHPTNDTESESEKRYGDYDSSHSVHEDTTQQIYYDESFKSEEAAGWRDPITERQTSEHAGRKGFYNRGSRPPYSNRNDRRYDIRPHYEDRDRHFERRQPTQHLNPTHSYRSLDSEHSAALSLQQDRRHLEHSAREGTKIGHKSTQKKFRRKPQKHYELSYGKDYSSCNEESEESGSYKVPKPHSSKSSNKYRKNSSSSSKQSYKDAIPEVDVSDMDKLIRDDLSRRAASMSLEQSASGSASGIYEKRRKDKQEATVRTGGVTLEAKYEMAERLKFIDPRMEREKQYRSVNPFVAGSFQAPISKKKKIELEFDDWYIHWNILEFNVVNEVEADLFEQPNNFSLAHCVAEDMRMGSGIAQAFRLKFNNVADLLDQRAKTGELATIHDERNHRYIYYLVTKQESCHKPTYYTLWKSLYKMKEHVIENQVRKIATPRLGCGLDHLDWDRVKSMMEWLFNGLNLEIRVCNFEENYGKTKKPLQTKTSIDIGANNKKLQSK